MAKFKVLALDGGGIRGAFGASFLAEIERGCGRPLAEYFDLIVGTSTGAILAAALVQRIPMTKIIDLYEKEGRVIFSPSAQPWYERLAFSSVRTVLRLFGKAAEFDGRMLFRSKYRTELLEKRLYQILGHVTIGDVHRRLLIPSVNLETGQTKVFKTPHIPNMIVDRKLNLVDVVLASAAAPCYFVPKKFDGIGSFIDGGLWANSPAIVGLTEAFRISRECKRDAIDRSFTENEIHVLAVGTGTAMFSHMAEGVDPGVFWWASKFLGASFITQAQGVNFQMKHLIADRYARIDFNLPGKFALDDVDLVQSLRAFGHQSATDPEKRKLIAPFVEEIAADYTAFD